ncbi:MAG: N-acetyltransferase [Sphingomonadales bacterium]|nr:MAG: N-acetyltransferase [Sphingomonadales bacterium]
MIRTERLLLTRPEARHRDALVRMLSDPHVMAQLVNNPTVESAEASLARHDGYATIGLGFWAVEQDGALAGLCGLKPGADNLPIAGELEIGWIFDKPYWGKGLAGEAARASLDWAWANRQEPRVVAITGATHVGSRRLMERLGMRYLPEMDFEHPLYADDDPMRQTVVYAIDRP